MKAEILRILDKRMATLEARKILIKENIESHSLYDKVNLDGYTLGEELLEIQKEIRKIEDCKVWVQQASVKGWRKHNG